MDDLVANRPNEEARAGNLAAARDGFGEALALNAEGGGLRGRRARILLNLGQIAVEEGELPGASALFLEAVVLARELGVQGSDHRVQAAVEGFASIAVRRGEANP